MTEQFELFVRGRVRRQLQALSAAVDHDPEGPGAHQLAVLLDALEAVESGDERRLDAERLGYSPKHYDLRDCAEIKVPMVQEFTRDGRPLGPSHRMIYREYEPTDGTKTPVRDVLCCERRAGGLAFEVAARELGRPKTLALDELRDLPNVVPAVGPNKDPDRPSSPPRRPLPPDVAAALATAIHARESHRPVAVAGRRTGPLLRQTMARHGATGPAR